MRLSVQATDIPSDYVLIDGTWVMPSRQEPLDEFLLGTRGLIDTNAIKAAPIADRLKTSAIMFGNAGISGQNPVAVYDRAGLFSAPWIWWLLRSHGVDAALVEGWADTEADTQSLQQTTFSATVDPQLMNASREDVMAALGTEVQILDARPPGRFAGTQAEPRPECRAGHIPGSINVPFGLLKEGRSFRDEDSLRTLFMDRSVDLSKSVITSCGSGVTASGLAFALSRCGAEDVRVYQGSWAEWGVDTDCPIETGS